MIEMVYKRPNMIRNSIAAPVTVPITALRTKSKKNTIKKPAVFQRVTSNSGATCRSRTGDLLITNQRNSPFPSPTLVLYTIILP